MNVINIILLLVMITYLALMVSIGAYMSRKNTSVDDFYLGGRHLGPFVTAMSAEASDMSSYLLMGLPGLAYLTGVCDVTWTAIGLAAGTYLNWLLVSRRIRRYTHRLGAITIPDFFSRRYHDDKNILSCIAAIIIIIFFIPYTASGFAACGKLFSSLFGAEYITAMVICAIVIAVYTTLGGFLAASTTDLIQSIVMTIALVVVVIYGTASAGGWNVVMENISSLPGFLSMNHTYDAAGDTAVGYGPVTVVSTLAWGLGYFGMPHILLRFMAVEEEEKLTLSRRIASIWVVISMGVAILIGVIGLAMSRVGVIPMLEGSNTETVLVEIARLLASHGVFAAIIAGVILSGILAATMSTADSQLLAASSSLSQNILVETLHLKINKKQSMILARVTVLIISVISIFLARDPDSNVFKIVSFAWAGFGASFGPIVLLALFWKRSNKQGAIAGMVTGGCMIFIWKFLVRPMGGVVDIYELLPAFLISLLVNICVSLATPEPDKSITDEFESV